MAVIATHLTTAVDGSDATSYTSASISPVANQILLIAVSSQVGSGTANIPTPTLSGWTFSQVKTVLRNTNIRITLFVGIGSGSGTVGFDFGGQTQQVAGWSITQFANTKTSGIGGSDAVVQNVSQSAGGATSYSITLAAFSDTNNATFSCVTKDAINDVVPGAGYTELGEATGASPNWDIESMWRSDNNTTPNATFNGSGGDNYAAIAIEIAFQQIQAADDVAYLM